MTYGLQPYGAKPYVHLSGFDPAGRMSAFNFCSSFDEILPPNDATIGALDRQHLWGMFIGIAAGSAVAVVSATSRFLLLLQRRR